MYDGALELIAAGPKGCLCEGHVCHRLAATASSLHSCARADLPGVPSQQRRCLAASEAYYERESQRVAREERAGGFRVTAEETSRRHGAHGAPAHRLHAACLLPAASRVLLG